MAQNYSHLSITPYSCSTVDPPLVCWVAIQFDESKTQARLYRKERLSGILKRGIRSSKANPPHSRAFIRPLWCPRVAASKQLCQGNNFQPTLPTLKAGEAFLRYNLLKRRTYYPLPSPYVHWLFKSLSHHPFPLGDYRRISAIIRYEAPTWVNYELWSSTCCRVKPYTTINSSH